MPALIGSRRLVLGLLMSVAVLTPAAQWTKQRAVTATNSTASAATNYPILITLTASNFDFASAASDGSDIRVLASDGATALAYWIESFDPSGQTGRIWANVPSIPANGAYTAYLVYGVSAAQPSKANGNNVFLFFDDFSSKPGWNRFAQNNPLIRNVASSWKANICGDPAVIPPDNVTNEWGAFFFGSNFNGTTQAGATGAVGDVGYMSSPDGKTWTEYASNPVFTHTQVALDYAIKPSVIFWPVTSTYYMAYAGQVGSGVWHIRMAKATSRTGPWTDLGSILQPLGDSVEGTRIDCPNLVIDGSNIRLYYSANKIASAASEPLNWCVAISTTGPEGTFIRSNKNPLSVPNGVSTKFGFALGGTSWRKLSDGTWDCAFNGFASNGTSYMGRFSSSDGFAIPTITDAMSLLELGPPGTWDEGKIYKPSIYSIGDGIDRVLYNGATPAAKEQIGYAELTQTPYDVTKWTPNPQGVASINSANGVLSLKEQQTTNPGVYFSMKSAYAPAAETAVEVRMRLDAVYEGTNGEAGPIILASATPFPTSAPNSNFLFISANKQNVRHQNRNANTYGTEDVVSASMPALGNFMRYRVVKHSASIDYVVMADDGTVVGSLIANTDAPQGTALLLMFGAHGYGMSFDSMFARPTLTTEPAVSVGAVSAISKTGL